MDIRQSDYWQTYLEKLGWKTISFDLRKIYIRKIPFGSLIKVPRVASKIPFKKIDEIAKKEGAFFVKLETNSLVGDEKILAELKSNKFQLDSWGLQPTKTIVIDLAPSEEVLLKNMEKDTRYSIRRSTREGVVVEKSQDIDKFLKLHKETSKRKGFWTSERESKLLWESLPSDNKAILLAKKNGEILAGAFLMFYDNKAYYYEAASSKLKRELLAPYLVVWEAIKLSKEKGYQVFDFEGIVDPRIKATKKWGGFTHFKRGFGGKEVTYLGSFVKYYNPIIKLIFSLNRFF